MECRFIVYVWFDVCGRERQACHIEDKGEDADQCQGQNPVQGDGGTGIAGARVHGNCNQKVRVAGAGGLLKLICSV